MAAKLVFILCAMMAQGALGMSHKADLSETGRDFFFTPSGKNSYSGVTDQVPVEDPQTAIARVNALTIPPGPAAPASINASVSGTYSTGLVLPDFTTCNCSSASIITTDLVNLEVGNRATVQWGSLLNFADFGTVVEIDGKARVRAVVNAMVPGSDVAGFDDGIGFVVSGTVDDVFVELIEGELRGERAIMIHHTATSPTPVDYHVEIVKFFNVDQVVMLFDPPNATDQGILNISSAQESSLATKATTNSCVLQVKGGRLIVRADVLQGEMLAIVESGARLSLDANVAFGDVLVESGGQADIKSVGLMVGNIEVQPSGKLICIINNHVGTISPSDPGDGAIDGIIDGVRYGVWRVLDEVVLKGVDTTLQTPVGLGTALQLTFGPAQVNPIVSVDVNGVITNHLKGQFKYLFELQPGRSIAGGVAHLYFRVLLNGVQEGEVLFIKMDGPNDDIPVKLHTEPLNLEVSDAVTVEFLRSVNGMNDGMLVIDNPTQAGWTAARSAIATVTRTL